MKILNQALWIVVLGSGVGVAHSWLEPIKIDRDATAPVDYTDLVAPPAAAPDSDAAPGAEPQADAPEPNPAPAAQPANAGNPGPFGPEINLEQARWLYENVPGVSFVDARNADQFQEGHIDGAYHLPPSAFDAAPPLFIDVVTYDAPVVVYCGGGDCTDSHNVVVRLEEFGFTRMHVFLDGYPAWVADGLPTNTGADPLGMPE